jgi:hypothetical protein
MSIIDKGVDHLSVKKFKKFRRALEFFNPKRFILSNKPRYIVFTSLLFSGVILNNYENLLQYLGMSNSRLKKRLDFWFGNEELDKTVKIEIPQNV